jgi:hypothetical protein
VLDRLAAQSGSSRGFLVRLSSGAVLMSDMLVVSAVPPGTIRTVHEFDRVLDFDRADADRLDPEVCLSDDRVPVVRA